MDVPDEEQITRYIRSKNGYSSRDNRVKADAFIAAPNRELSVACIHGLEEPDVWALGESFIHEQSIARADILAGNVKSAGLTIDRDDTPPRHANILGWNGK